VVLEELDGRVLLEELGKWDRLDDLLSSWRFDGLGMTAIVCARVNHDVYGGVGGGKVL
jgi:hypothetical protein